MSSPDSSRLGHLWRGLTLTSTLALVGLSFTPVLAQDESTAAPTIGPFGDITTYRVNDERTAVHPGTVPDTTPALIWSVKLASEMHFHPAIVDGTLFVGDYDGIFHALDPATGHELWSYDAGNVISHAATAEDGVIVFTDHGGRVHALDVSSGDVLWTSDGLEAQEIVDGVVYASSQDGILHGLDLKTGAETWSQQFSAPVRSLTISGGVAYIGSKAGEVFAISLPDGTQLWRPIHLLSNLPSSMPIADGILFTSSSQPPGEPAGEMLAIDASSGEVLWRFRTPAGTQVGPGAVYDGTLYAPSQDDGLYAFDARTGSVKWHIDAPTTFNPAVFADDTVIVAGVDGDLVAYDPTNGDERWRVKAGTGADAGPAISGGLIFMVDGRGYLYAFGDAALAGTVDAALAEPTAEAAEDQPPVAATTSSDSFVHVATWDASMVDGLDHPSGADMGPDGLYYLVNAGSDEIIVLDADGAVVRRWGELGTGEGQFDFQRNLDDPASDVGGVAVAPDGTVFVADTVNRRVQVFTPEGEFLRQIGSYGSGDGQFLEPFDLDVAPDGSVYVVDDVRDDIQRFTADGKYLQTIGRHGTGDGELAYTGSIVVAPDGMLVNADFENQRVQAWDADGNFLWTHGRQGTESGEFNGLVDVAVDEMGRLFVSDMQNNRVQALSPTGDPRGEFQIPPDDVSWSSAITYAGNGRLYLNNPFGDRIHVLEYVGE